MTTKSMSASQSRWRRPLFSCGTELLARSFHFEHEIECSLVLDRTLAVRSGPASEPQLSVPFPYEDGEPFSGRYASH